MQENKKKIVVVGGGYGGLVSAVLLSKKLGAKAEITLIDKEDYQLYYPYLYESATSEEEFISIEQLKRSITIPFAEALPRGVRFIKGTLGLVDRENKTVTISPASVAPGTQEIPFDFLILALGSKTEFFGVKGLEQNALTLKSLEDCLRIRNSCESAVAALAQDMAKKTVRFIIGGGGFSGVELAGEFTNFIKILSWKYNFPLDKIEIMLVEGTAQLLPGLSPEVSAKVLQRLRDAGVVVRLNNFIADAEKNHVVVSTGETINYDLLVWTGGVRSIKIPFAQPVETDSKDRIIVNEHFAIAAPSRSDSILDNHGEKNISVLHSGAHTEKETQINEEIDHLRDTVAQRGENIFVIGDCSAFRGHDKDKRPQPQTATVAIAEAEYIAEHIFRIVGHKNIQPFVPKEHPYIISVKGKWAILHAPSGFLMTGFLAWFFHVAAYARYLMRFMPFFRAFKRAWFSARMFVRND